MIVRWQLLAAAIAAWAGFSMFPMNGAIAQQDWPQKPVRIIVPYATGGTSDLFGRLIAPELAGAFKQSFVVENIGGAAGGLGAQRVAGSAPDGYTLMISDVGSHVVNPLVFKSNALFDTMRDFTQIALLGGPPMVLAVNSALPISDLKDFVAYVKAQPNGLNWGSPGFGSQGHLIGEIFRSAGKLNMVHINYKGAGPAIIDLQGNQIPAAFAVLSSVAPGIKSGKLRVLASTSEQRLGGFPDLPTFAELGRRDLTLMAWFALSAPANLPKPIVARLNAEARRAIKTPAMQARFADLGIVSVDMDAAAFGRFVQLEIDRYAPIVEALPKEVP